VIANKLHVSRKVILNMWAVLTHTNTGHVTTQMHSEYNSCQDWSPRWRLVGGKFDHMTHDTWTIFEVKQSKVELTKFGIKLDSCAPI